jgi:PPOX class probable F420-dependent enzyme
VDLDRALEFVGQNHRAILATRRADGGPQMSPVAVTGDGAGNVVISSRVTAMKTKNIQRDDRVSICVMNDGFYGEWIQIDGQAEVVLLPEAMDGLVEYYRSISGEHPNWDDYRAAMEREQRVLLRVKPERAGPDISG